ncbi:MAG TPA: MgtC/SapB family protein [Thermoanaerobaculia bacterium]|nr:MgtC/SapB family protein [Thermoanaerobaculia bacterium]
MRLDPAFVQLAVALGLGLLVGLQRETTGSALAGIRTFALVTVLGAVAGALSGDAWPWVVAASLVALALLIFVGDLAEIRGRGREVDPGLTTEVALLLMLLVGVLAGRGRLAEATVVGGGTALLLHLKERLHGFVGGLDARDQRAIMQFALVSLVILPVLPDRTFGPFDVVNPREVWWMVVLIVGLSLGGYVAYRLLGARAGSVAGGALGGLISSTATTVTYARRSGERPGADELATMAIVLASAVTVVRILVELAVVVPARLGELAAPIVLSGLVLLALAAVAWRRSRGQEIAAPEPRNPSELRTALVFAALYVGVLLAVAATREHLGATGLYAVAVLSGLTDVDAITLSTARMLEAERLAAPEAWRVVLTAATANLAFKGGAVVVLGSPRLRRQVVGCFALAAIANLLLIWLW